LFHWQIVEGKVLSAQARGQYEYKSEVDAPRGSILATDGSYLVTSGQAWTIAAAIPEMKDDDGPLDKRKVADSLAPFFAGVAVEPEDGEDKKDQRDLERDASDRIYNLLTKDKIMWTPLKSRVSDETKKKIEELKISGIHFEPEEIRQYPEGSVGAQLLGFVG